MAEGFVEGGGEVVPRFVPDLPLLEERLQSREQVGVRPRKILIV